LECQQRDPKKHVMRRIDRQNRAMAQCNPKNRVKKVAYETKTRVRRDHLGRRSATWIYICGHTRDVDI